MYARALLVLTTLLASVICGVVYTYIHFYISVVYVKVPAAILTPVFAGFAVLLAAFGCRCRSRVFVILMGGLAGLLTLYFSWVTYASLIAGDHAFSGRWAALAASPQELFRKIEVISHQPLLKGEIGSAFTTETSPWERMTYWIAEALALVVGAIVMVYFTFGDIVYCEKCAAWCQAGSPPAYFDAREASQAARAGDLRALVAGPASSRKVPPCLQLVFHICPRCKTWIAYRVVEIKPGKQGQGSNVENLRATFRQSAAEQRKPPLDRGLPRPRGKSTTGRNASTERMKMASQRPGTAAGCTKPSQQVPVRTFAD